MLYEVITDVDSAVAKIDEVVLQKFKEVYKEGEIKKGKNYLAFEVAKRNVYNFLKLEQDRIRLGEAIKIVMLETELKGELIHPALPFPVKISGKVDRIELCNGKLRIVDYKTGRVVITSYSIHYTKLYDICTLPKKIIIRSCRIISNSFYSVKSQHLLCSA